VKAGGVCGLILNRLVQFLFLNRLFPAIILLFLMSLFSGCAHIEAPVHSFTADEWTQSKSSQLPGELEITLPNTVEVIIVETGPGYGTFGHAAIHVGKYAYSWDYGGGYILVKQTFSDFLNCYTQKHNRSITGIVIAFPDDAIKRLVKNLDHENLKARLEGYNRGSSFLVNNCSTLVFKELIKASGVKAKGWPPILLPDWMGKNVERTFPLLYYNFYKKAEPSKEGQ
jgi:hypothetical protein